ncbi:MAG TPA: hypothetical protein VFL85_01540 [Candidatus Saccharimonadales bacterium]|nr:hypothetical protein [Candidatus Saccharimonadales bacterium]
MATQNTYIGSAVSPAVPVTKEYSVADGVTVNSGDFVYLASGRVTNATVAGKTLLGMVVGKNTDPSDVTDTTASTGNTAGTVKVLVNVEPNAKFVVTNDNVGTTFAASHVGQCFDLTGSTDAQLVDTSTAGTTGQLECIGFGFDGDNTKGVYIINEHKYKVNA